jgi:hypothetical protein
MIDKGVKGVFSNLIQRISKQKTFINIRFFSKTIKIIS